MILWIVKWIYQQRGDREMGGGRETYFTRKSSGKKVCKKCRLWQYDWSALFLRQWDIFHFFCTSSFCPLFFLLSCDNFLVLYTLTKKIEENATTTTSANMQKNWKQHKEFFSGEREREWEKDVGGEKKSTQHGDSRVQESNLTNGAKQNENYLWANYQ